VIDESNVICVQGHVKIIGTGGWLMTRCTNNFAQVMLSVLIIINVKCSPIQDLTNVTGKFYGMG